MQLYIQLELIFRLREFRGHNRSLKCVEWKPMSQNEFATGARNNFLTLQHIFRNSNPEFTFDPATVGRDH